MTPDQKLQRLLELAGGRNVTIKAASSGKGGNIDRKKADRILDPHDYFGKNKRKNHFREYLERVELQEMRIRYQDTAPEYVLAFQDSIWTLGRTVSRAVLRDIKRLTGLKGDTVHTMMGDAQDNRPDVLTGHLHNNRLTVDGVVSINMNPRSSLLIKKVVQQLGLDGVAATRLGTDGDEYEDEFEPDELEGQIPEIVYHGTSTTYINRILRVGLAPNKIMNWDRIGNFADKIFLTSTFGDACFHANDTADKKGGVPIVIATRIPDRNRITLDYDVGATMHGITPAMDREGYSASVRRNHDKFDATRVKRIAKYHKGTDYTREIGIFGYRGRIPSNFFSAMFIPAEEGRIDPQEAVEIDNRAEMLRALEMIDEFGYYDPNYEPDEDEEYDPDE